jgi:general secretion pathway protein K
MKLGILAKRRRNVRGATLILALWALFLLSAMVISWAVEINSHIVLSASANRMLDAEAMACSGAEVALHPVIKPGSPSLEGLLGKGKSYDAKVTGEGGRLNINWLIAGEDPTRLGILRKYLELKGIDMNERDHMIDCLLDWVDPDNIPRLNGAEESDDYHPDNTLLTRIDTLKKIKGWEQFTSSPGWDDDFTLNSSGPIDVTWASRDVLLCLPGLTDAMVDRFLQIRQGADGVDGTSDDTEFKTPDDVRVAMSVQDAQFKQLSPLISVKDPVYRVVSVGKAGDATHVVQLVFRRVGVVPQVITWKEF